MFLRGLNPRRKRDDDHAQSLKRIDEAQVVTLKQSQVQEKLCRHKRNSDGEGNSHGARTKSSFRVRRGHGVFQENLASRVGNERDQDNDERDCRHNSSSKRATGFATIARPNETNAIPIQRRVTIFSPRISQLPSGTSTCTPCEMGNAIESG